MDDLDLIFWQKETKKLIKNIFENIRMEEIDGDKFLFPTYKKLEATIPIIELSEYEKIVKLVGNLKSHFGDRGLDVYFRGQRCDHNYYQYPSFVRSFITGGNTLDQSEFNLNITKLYDLINKMHNEISENNFINSLTIEPLLQHYGLHTRWLDIVDNLPIALKFALKTFQSDCRDNNSEFGYLFIYGLKSSSKLIKGVYESKNVRIINLREANDPTGLRPHVQHAYLFCDKRLINSDLENDKERINYYANYMKYLLCVVKIPHDKLKKWFGGSNEGLNHLFTDSTLFPDARYDLLLEELNRLYKRINLKSPEGEETFSKDVFGRIN